MQYRTLSISLPIAWPDYVIDCKVGDRCICVSLEIFVVDMEHT